MLCDRGTLKLLVRQDQGQIELEGLAWTMVRHVFVELVHEVGSFVETQK